MISLWIAISLGCAGFVSILALIWIVCEIQSRKRSARNRRMFEMVIYNQERDRAEKTLQTLQQANIGKSHHETNSTSHLTSAHSPPVITMCTHDTPTTHKCIQQDIYCVPPSAPPVVSHCPRDSCKKNFSCSNVPVNTELHHHHHHCYPGDHTFYHNSEPIMALAAPKNLHGISNVCSTIRLARTESEIPPYPPPIAPPGFVTVPVTVDRNY